MLKRLLAVLFIGACAFAVAPPSVGSNWAGATGLSNCSGQNKTENAAVAVSFPDVTSAIKNSVLSANTYITGATDVTMSTTTSLVYDDIRIFDAGYTQLCGYQTAYGNYLQTGNWVGVIAVAKCMSVHGSGSAFKGSCDRHYIYFDESTKDVLTAAKLKANAVHEIGHALGLNHRTVTSSVMKQDNLAVYTFDTHDKGHLNAAY